jgi:hypothetical protein
MSIFGFEYPMGAIRFQNHLRYILTAEFILTYLSNWFLTPTF